jgi:biotin transporter BioY
MNFKSFFSEFTDYNKKVFKKLIIITIFGLYFTFLIAYNYFRITLDYSMGSSWRVGILSALISTLILIFVFDLALFSYKRKKDRFYALKVKNRSK